MPGMHVFRVVVHVAVVLLCLNLPAFARETVTDRAETLAQQAEELYQQGRYSEAVPIVNKILTIHQTAHGDDHPTVAEWLNRLAELYRNLGDYALAEPLYKRSLVIREKAYGQEHPDVAQSLNNLALLYTSLGDFALAEPLYKRSLNIFEKSFGPEHPAVALSLNNLALLYTNFGDYGRAEPLYKRSLAIREESLGGEHLDVAQSLNNLARLYTKLGQYSRAEPLYKKSLSIVEKILGPEHPTVAFSLNNLALLYKSLGDFAQAEPLYKRALAIREKALGPEHPAVALSLNNLAELYRAIRDYSRAEPLYKKSLAIQEKALGPEHPDVAQSLNNLALLYAGRRDYSRAKPLYKRALVILEKTLGPEHPNVGLSLNNLALLFFALGDRAQAEPLQKRSLNIFKKALGPEHPNVALSLNNLGRLYFASGDYSRAEPFYKESLNIWEKTLGPEHPNVAWALNNLTWLYAAKGDYETALKLQDRSQAIAMKTIDQVMGFTTEEQKLKFLTAQQWALKAVISLVVLHLSDQPAARKAAFDYWLRRKGLTLEAQRRFQEALVYSDQPEAIKTFQELARVRAGLSQLVFSEPGEEGPAVYRKRIARLTEEKDRLEARLSRLSRAFARRKTVRWADSEEVARNLPNDSVLLEFARVEMANFKDRSKRKKWFPAHYLAFVLHPVKGKVVDLVDLGEAEPIDQTVADFKRAVTDLKDIRGAGADAAGRRLYELVFAKLKPKLGEVKEIFISPDGNLNLIPFEVLQGPEGRYLIEDYTFNYLTAGRDVLGFGEAPGRAGKALVIGDPDFNLGGEEMAAAILRLELRGRAMGTGRLSAGMRGLSFNRLPGTLDEVTAIQDILGPDRTELYTGKEALEELLIKIRSPRILHLATHGFFLTDQDISSLADDPNRAFTIDLAEPKPEVIGKMGFENPLLRSGLALAGANNAVKSTSTNRTDGLLTAEEVLGLQLWGTELVVLSACNTGLGEVKCGEGVYGLRRAFIQAGAKGLVMSMWPVPDKETRELMVEFYKNIVSGRMNRPQALRQAALRQMQTARDRYGRAHPLFWGAFVFLGEP